jgi:integrase/recombinase XerD
MNHNLDYAQTWLNRLRNHLQARSYSQNTCDNYCDAVAFFLQAFPGHPNRVTGRQVQTYLLDLKTHHLLKETTINLQLDGIRYFYNHIVQQPELLKDVKRMKEKVVLPSVLSAQEVHRLLSMTMNKKHQLILALAYGSGLRLSELVGLQTCDIDFEREIVMVRNGKGGKLLRHPFARIGHRYPLYTSPARPCQHQNHRTLYPCCRPAHRQIGEPFGQDETLIFPTEWT